MKLLIGLGNPGKKYETTRHNVGFMVLDALAKKLGSTSAEFSLSKKFNADILESTPGALKGEKLLLIKPQTYMNNSGTAVQTIAGFYKIVSKNIWVIYDDIDLPLGALRIRASGGSGGHNGVQSIIDQLGTKDFTRVRLGIGPVPDPIDPADYVLQKFSTDEMKVMTKSIDASLGEIISTLKEKTPADQ